MAGSQYHLYSPVSLISPPVSTRVRRSWGVLSVLGMFVYICVCVCCLCPVYGRCIDCMDSVPSTHLLFTP